MAASTIIVQHRDGSPATGKRVVLQFDSGMTDAQFTNREGRVVIEHRATGTAVVYVAGDACETFRAPGKAVVTLR